MKMNNIGKLKIIVIGPIGIVLTARFFQSGKSMISNFLADATEIASDYRPTKGARILEYETQNINVKDKLVKAEIELWDCSGDHKYESCWPAIRSDARGVIMVYDSKSKDYIEELELLYDYFVKQNSLGPKNCLILYHDQNSDKQPKKMPQSLAWISQVSCNVDEGGNKLRVDMQSFIATLISGVYEETHEEEISIMQDNILFNK